MPSPLYNWLCVIIIDFILLLFLLAHNVGAAIFFLTQIRGTAVITGSVSLLGRSMVIFLDGFALWAMVMAFSIIAF